MNVKSLGLGGILALLVLIVAVLAIIGVPLPAQALWIAVELLDLAHLM